MSQQQGSSGQPVASPSTPRAQGRRNRAWVQPSPSRDSSPGPVFSPAASPEMARGGAIAFSSPARHLPAVSSMRAGRPRVPEGENPAGFPIYRTVHGVAHPEGPVNSDPANINTRIVQWPNDMVRRRPAFVPRGELGREAMLQHFPTSRLPIASGVHPDVWYDRLILAYNMIGRLDGREYLSDFELQPILQLIAENHARPLFWTPGYPMLDTDAVRPLSAEQSSGARHASLIVHLLRFADGGGHYGVVIFDSQSQRWLFADSWAVRREARFDLVARRLREWLVRNRLISNYYNVERFRDQGTILQITEQTSSWTCGLIALEFVRSFMRLGAGDWVDRRAVSRESAEQLAISSWGSWLRRELGHDRGTVVRQPSVPALTYDRYLQQHWQQTAPPPSSNPAGRSQQSPLNLSSSGSASPDHPSQSPREGTRSRPISISSSAMSDSPPGNSFQELQFEIIDLTSPSPPPNSSRRR
ncbi:hypothetical protein F4815DRAFT_475802 [Daldinia loculata]|nr:hypothetical protein F4815DRAFT_475802 [Daldinia loculata]